MQTSTLESNDAAAASDAVRCPRCGSAALEGADYCNSCGASLALDWGAPPPAAPRRRIGGTKWSPHEEVLPNEVGTLRLETPYTAPSRNDSRRKYGKPRRRTRRRVAVVLLIAVLLVSTVASALALRTRSTLDQVNSLSAIPVQVTDA